MLKSKMKILNFQKELQNIIPHSTLEIPPIEKFGHVSFNGLMINKSPEKKEEVLQYLAQQDFIEKFEIVGSGFLNIFFKPFLNIEKPQIIIHKNENLHIEYCSPNPTGDLHLGHFRNIIIGMCLCNLMKLAGFNVISEMYINDQGTQINQFIETIKHYKDPSNSNFEIHYKGDYTKNIADNCASNNINNKEIIAQIVQNIQTTLKKINIEHDSVVFESSLYEEMHEVMKILKEKNLIYTGNLENQKEEGNHLILKTSELGFDVDTVIQRDNGVFTYYAFDIAYHYNKLKRGFINQICILGSDHSLHMEKLTKVLKILFNINLKVLKYEMFFLIKNNERVSMSKREGNSLTIDDILKEIDLNYLKWIIMSHNVNKTINFNPEKITTENPILILKYVLMRLDQLEVTNEEPINIDSVYRKCIFFPIVFEHAVKNLDAHKLLIFIFDLCDDVKKFLDLLIGNKISEKNMRILKNSKDIITLAVEIMDIK